MENEYPILRFAILFTRILAYISLILGVGASLIILFGHTPGSGKLASLGVLFMGGVYAVGFFLLSELIRLLLDMAQRLSKIENTVNPKREIH